MVAEALEATMSPLLQFPALPSLCCYSWSQSQKPPFNFIRHHSLNPFHFIRSCLPHSIPLLSFVPSSFHLIPAFSIRPVAALCFVAGPAHRARRFSVCHFFYFHDLFSMVKNNSLKSLQRLRFRILVVELVIERWWLSEVETNRNGSRNLRKPGGWACRSQNLSPSTARRIRTSCFSPGRLALNPPGARSRWNLFLFLNFRTRFFSL
jgi:hypothetical protein